MANSINTNISAYYAQLNIGIAANNASSSVSRLSSGNRIVKSSDDVAALATGTSLQTNVSALRTALGNAAQANSLLSVADGALSQINEILQRQKSIALQASSGQLTDTQRGFLDQEFQALVNEIDRLTESTSFNGVTLLDGSLSGSNPLMSDEGANTATITGFTAQTGITAVAFTDDADSTVGDTTFYGDLSTGVFEVQFATTPDFIVSYTINGSTYVGQVIDVGATTASLALSNGEGVITFTLAADISATYAASVAGADAFADALTEAFSASTGFNERVLMETDDDDVVGSAIEVEDTNGTLFDGFDGNDVTIRSQYWDGQNAPTIANFSVIGEEGLGIKFSVQIDGRTYTTDALIDETDIVGADAFGNGADLIRFYLDGDSTTNPNEYMTLSTAGITQNIDLDTEENVSRFLETLNDIFGRTGGGLSFQVGTASTDVLAVSVASAESTTLYGGTAINVLTQLAAQSASTALDTALASVTAIRAGIGALQSRFNFASASIQISIQNQDAARGSLLDTDIATESTAYATSQVKLQAGISVLAQANQQLQSLLKLIG